MAKFSLNWVFANLLHVQRSNFTAGMESDIWSVTLLRCKGTVSLEDPRGGFSIGRSRNVSLGWQSIVYQSARLELHSPSEYGRSVNQGDSVMVSAASLVFSGDDGCGPGLDLANHRRAPELVSPRYLRVQAREYAVSVS